LGNDVFAEFGDHFTLPIFGNFDPPVADSSVSGSLMNNTVNPYDVNNDGYVAPDDVLMVINQINSESEIEVTFATMWTGPFMDVDSDNYVAPSDALEIINYLNAQSDHQPEAESAVDATLGQESDAWFDSLMSDSVISDSVISDSVMSESAMTDSMISDSDVSDDLLMLLASDAATSKKRS
jgi:hypothetical protein